VSDLVEDLLCAEWDVCRVLLSPRADEPDRFWGVVPLTRAREDLRGGEAGAIDGGTIGEGARGFDDGDNRNCSQSIEERGVKGGGSVDNGLAWSGVS
jgi:hypothetical protein